MSGWANTAAARSWASVKGPADHGRRYIEGLADALDAARAALWAGADSTPPAEGATPTPTQWVGMFVALGAEERLQWAGRVLANAADALACWEFQHQARLDGVEREVARRCFRSYGCAFRAGHDGDCRTRDGQPAEPVAVPVGEEAADV